MSFWWDFLHVEQWGKAKDDFSQELWKVKEITETKRTRGSSCSSYCRWHSIWCSAVFVQFALTTKVKLSSVSLALQLECKLKRGLCHLLCGIQKRTLDWESGNLSSGKCNSTACSRRSNPGPDISFRMTYWIELNTHWYDSWGWGWPNNENKTWCLLTGCGVPIWRREAHGRNTGFGLGQIQFYILVLSLSTLRNLPDLSMSSFFCG